MSADGFWLFEGLEETPYGLLPLLNLSGKGGASSTKEVDRVGSYQWRLEEDEPVILVPGQPLQSTFWPGGRLVQDRGVLIYDINRLKVKKGSLDTLVLAAKLSGERRNKPINFNDFDFITDAINLQKLFAFAQEAGEGLFRIDCERVGKTVLLSRVEASDLMEIGHCTFDQALKSRIGKSRSKHTTGPFFQMVAYTFGSFRILVRYEVDCADYVALRVADADPAKDPAELPAKKQFAENKGISYIEFGDSMPKLPLQLLTTYPDGAGFPYFTWAQMFFTNADQELVGFFKQQGDFGKCGMYALPDVSKLMKPLPYVVLAKVHDALAKVQKFLVRNDADFRCGLIWKGKPHLEIYAKLPEAEGAVTPAVRELLLTQCVEPEAEGESATAADPAASTPSPPSAAAASKTDESAAAKPKTDKLAAAPKTTATPTSNTTTKTASASNTKTTSSTTTTTSTTSTATTPTTTAKKPAAKKSTTTTTSKTATSSVKK